MLYVLIKIICIPVNNINFSWNRLTMKEKEIIISLLDHPLKRIENAKYISVITGSLSASLKKLHNLGLIGVNNENLYEIQKNFLQNG